jgi:hypothetical protein
VRSADHIAKLTGKALSDLAIFLAGAEPATVLLT